MVEGAVELAFRGCDDTGKIAGEPQRRPVSEGSFRATAAGSWREHRKEGVARLCCENEKMRSVSPGAR